MKVCDYDDEIVVANDEKDENIKGGTVENEIKVKNGKTKQIQ